MDKEMKRVNCGICDQEMDCPESMLKAEKHVCSCCSEVMAEGMSDEEIKINSLEEREASRHYDDMGFIANLIHNASYGSAKLAKKEIREMRRNEVMEEMYFRGIVTTLRFILKTDPLVMEKAKKHFMDNARAGLQKEGADEETIEKILYTMTASKEDLMKDAETKGLMHDPNKMANYRGDVTTAEGIATMINETAFQGDWEKHIKWIEEHGSEKQKEEVPMIKKLMEAGRK